jgi:hypothetical protein
MKDFHFANMNIVKLSFILIALQFTVQSIAQSFPTIQAENVKGQKLEIPKDLNAKKSIVFLAFTQQAEEVLDNWYAPVYTMFIDESGFNAMAYDCHVKLIMMFTGVGQSAANGIIKKIKDNVDDEFNDYLLFYQGDFKDQMKALELDKKNDAYVFVLDEKGKIIFKDSGRYSESKLEKIADLVEL